MRCSFVQGLMTVLVFCIGCSGSTMAEGPDEELGGLDHVSELEVDIRRVLLTEAFEVRQGSKIIRTAEIVEFEVRSVEPIPARALDPVLMIDSHAVREYRYEAPNVLVFTEAVPETLPSKGKIAFQWGQDPLPHQRTETGKIYDEEAVPRVER